MTERYRQSEYYGCDCDKYNPNCRCYPRSPEPVETEDIETRIRQERLKHLDSYTDEELIEVLSSRGVDDFVEHEHRVEPDND